MWKTITTLLITALATGVFSQIPVQNIRGKVIDGHNGMPIIGASVLLPGTEPLAGTSTDSAGVYRLNEVPVGRYQLKVSFLGYETIVIPDLLVVSGKELVLNIKLFQSETNLGEVLVRATDTRSSSQSSLSLHTLSVEESFRFPATFNDPARLTHTFAGVANTNDQANHTSIRGNSPNSMSWRLEGAEIVNPNHLSNAGTFTDRPAQSGGGVNILSAQLLGTSNFYTGAFPVEYGNVLGGVMDMRFRNGNDEQHEFTAQAGLIGFDFAAEGPLSKDEGVSYLVNYRYSFVGLLAAMGVDFGGESIAFQDLSFNIKAPVGKNGVVKVFGMGGLSENQLTAERDPTAWETVRDRRDVIFKNKMGAFGANLTTGLNDRSVLNFTAVTSALETTLRADILGNDLTLFQDWPIDTIFNRKVSLTSSLSYKLNAQHHFLIGLSAMNQLYDLLAVDYYVWAQGRKSGWMQDAFVQWKWLPRAPFRFQLGLHQSYYTLSESHSLEPRGSVSWLPDSKNEWSFAYGLHSQMQSPHDYLEATGEEDFPNLGLGFSKAHHLVLGYNRKLNPHSKLGVELYYQSLFDIPVSANGSWGSYSVLNALDMYRSIDLANEGTGTNYGLEISWQQFMVKDFYYLVNASLFDSKYKGSDGVERDTRYSNNYIFNATGGKEYSWEKEDKQKTLGLNVRVTLAGGLKTTPIDLEASDYNSFTSYDDRKAYSLQQKQYFKVDFRVYFKNDKSKYTSTLALDLQNVTNTKNEAFRYYDYMQDKVLVQYQLGLIPNLSYRIEF